MGSLDINIKVQNMPAVKKYLQKLERESKKKDKIIAKQAAQIKGYERKSSGYDG